MSDERPESSDSSPDTGQEPRAEASGQGGATSHSSDRIDDGAREALAALGERARSIVEQLARSAAQEAERRAGDEAARRAREGSGHDRSGAHPDRAASARPSAIDAAMPELHRRLGELRACIGEVSDVLEATVERLETVEDRLGDADQAVERTIADGIARCERMLSGIEHRVSRGKDTERAPAAAPSRPPVSAGRTVVVVARASRLRSELCLALERQGLFALAALDALGARHALDRSGGAAAALLAFAGSQDDCLLAMERWKSAERDGLLPPAAVWITGDDSPAVGRDAAVCELPVLLESHGEAALAASLLEMTRTRATPA